MVKNKVWFGFFPARHGPILPENTLLEKMMKENKTIKEKEKE